jgi:hypothetical protein
MSTKFDCNIDTNLNLDGRCICETCAPGKYKTLVVCNDAKECVLMKEKTNKYYTEMYQCRRCEVGRYQNEIGRNDCKNCDVGQYQDVTTSTPSIPSYANKPWQPYTDNMIKPTIKCKTCPTGYIPSVPIQSTCMSCKKGYEYDSIYSPCRNCISGKYQPFGETSFTDDNGLYRAIKCKRCQAGRGMFRLL